MAATCLKPWPEHGEATTTHSDSGCRMTNRESGVTVYRHVSARRQRTVIAASYLGGRSGRTVRCCVQVTREGRSAEKGLYPVYAPMRCIEGAAAAMKASMCSSMTRQRNGVLCMARSIFGDAERHGGDPYGVQLDFNPLPTAVESISRSHSESLAKRVADTKHGFESPLGPPN